ncbi:MAG TPA: 6-hydroxymethylpterin diphosphokinase MptE-like protein, partial [Chlamydiales bacterium]|nr:6-hydroxymethylpterin diphosphokinase MptE-like protein [Chlamydiales bacterium]
MSNPHFDAGSADIICKYGISLDFYAQAKPWLEAEEGRRLFWIEKCPQRFAQYNEQPLQDSRVQIFYVETLLDQELALQKIAWLSVYKKLEILDLEWKLRIETKYLAAQLLAADAADFGLSVARHARANFRKPMRKLSGIRGSMKGVPAIVIGAGPSLEKNGHLLEAWQDKALLITAGSAIHSVQTRPSLAVMLDPHQSIGKPSYAGVPFCIQGRTHPKTRTCTSGEVLYFADSHFA